VRRLFGIAEVLWSPVAALVRAYKHRHDIRLLNEFDDRMLADIGLTRGDLRDAVAEPAWRDPSALLTQRVRSRRAARARGFNPDMKLETHAAPPTVPNGLDEWSSRLFPARSRYY
jgi:uncharacterized protein YjiS (DUF1127 family)